MAERVRTSPLDAATEIVIAGRKPQRSVILDGAEKLSTDWLRAVALLTKALYTTVCVEDGFHHLARVTDAIKPYESLTLDRVVRKRPDHAAYAAGCWGRSDPASFPDGPEPEVLLSTPQAAADLAAARWAEARRQRIAVVPLDPDLRREIANRLIRHRIESVWATDLHMSRSRADRFGKAGIYVLRAEEVSGLEFDQLIVVGADLLKVDISLPHWRSALVGIANAVTRRLTITWSGHGTVPSMIRALKRPSKGAQH